MTNFASSWSRRRAAVAAETEAEELAVQEAVIEAEQAELAEKPDAEILEELNLPDPDTMVQGDDFKVFLAKTVPQHLRKRALRTLWRSNPVLACVDGLNDYDDDYLTASLGQGPIKTSYQVGKGMLAHLLEVDRLKETPAEVPEVEADPHEDLPEAADDDVLAAVALADVDEAPGDFAPRRMKFQFEDDAA